MTNKSDTDLIARMAEKLGWRQEQCPGRKLWVNPDGNYQALPMHIRRLLRSADACRALLDENKYFNFSWNESGEERSEHRLWRVFYHSSENAKPIYDKSLPRAILLALLEVE